MCMRVWCACVSVVRVQWWTSQKKLFLISQHYSISKCQTVLYASLQPSCHLTMTAHICYMFSGIKYSLLTGNLLAESNFPTCILLATVGLGRPFPRRLSFCSCVFLNCSMHIRVTCTYVCTYCNMRNKCAAHWSPWRLHVCLQVIVVLVGTNCYT